MQHRLSQKGDLSNPNLTIFHLENSLGCESAGFQLGQLKFLCLPKNVRTPYSQALLGIVFMFVFSSRSCGILSSHNCMKYKNNNMYNKTFKGDNIA